MLGLRLGFMMLKVFSNLKVSVIPHESREQVILFKYQSCALTETLRSATRLHAQ